MRGYFAALLCLIFVGSSVNAAVPSRCVSGCNIPEPPPQSDQSHPELSRVFHFQAIQNSSDFWLREAQRPERLPAISRLNLPIRDNTSLLTGPTGNAKITLADQTTVSLSPNTELRIEKFESTNGRSATVTIRVVKGKMRWYHRALLSVLNVINPQMRMPRGSGSVRGTEFEFAEDGNGTGYVRVYSGVFVYTAENGGSVYEVNPGQQLTWQNSEIVGIEQWGE